MNVGTWKVFYFWFELCQSSYIHMCAHVYTPEHIVIMYVVTSEVILQLLAIQVILFLFVSKIWANYNLFTCGLTEI